MPPASPAERRRVRLPALILLALAAAGVLAGRAPAQEWQDPQRQGPQPEAPQLSPRAARDVGPEPEIREASDVGGLEAHSAALILSGQQGGELAASVLVVPLPGSSAETVRLALVVDLAGETLLTAAGDAGRDDGKDEDGDRDDGSGDDGGSDDGAQTFVTEVHAYAVGSDDALGAHFTQAFSLDSRELEARDGWAGVKFLGTLEVPPGEWSIRLLVRQRESGRLALRAISVTARELGAPGGEPVVLPPLFPESTERWTLVGQSGSADRVGGFPLRLGTAVPGAGPLVPSTRPVLQPGGRVFYLLGRGLGEAGRAGADRGWMARAVPAGREPSEPEAGEDPTPPEQGAAQVEVSRRGRLVVGGPELEVLEVSLDPAALTPGAGTLAISGPGGERTTVPVVVTPPGMDLASADREMSGGAPLWVDLMALRAAPTPVPVPRERTTEAVAITDRNLARFQAAYLGALGHLATGDRSAALAAVEEVERSGMSGGTGVDVLARGQLQVALDVSGGAGDRLLPLVRLHEDLYDQHRRRGERALAAHARRVTLGLIELYLRHADDEDRGRVAAAALVGVAGQLLAHGNSLETLGILELALEHDSEHPSALLLLAAVYELLGDSREAVDLLRRLEAVTPARDPLGAEGRLRLGVNLGRLGSTRAAAERLESCLPGKRPRWVRVVAYEELAALHVAEGRPEQAVRLLEQALQRLPRQQRLYIQLAAVHESLGRPAQARAVLDELEARMRRGVGRDRDSPRLRYTEWSQEAIDRSRGLFERAAAARMPALAEALASFTARGG